MIILYKSPDSSRVADEMLLLLCVVDVMIDICVRNRKAKGVQRKRRKRHKN